MQQQNKGFSLIELSVIVIILALLSIADITHFKKLMRQIRVTTLISTGANINSTVAISMLKFSLNRGAVSNTHLKFNPTTVVTINPMTGIPTGTKDGIGVAANLNNNNGFIVDYTNPQTVTIKPKLGGNTHCQLIYDGTSGSVTVNSTGC